MKILVTGAAGFIGAHLMYKLAKRGDDVVGIDYLSDYNDIRLKLSRLEHCGFMDTKPFKAGSMCTSSMFSNCRFQKVDIADKPSLYRLFHDGQFDKVVHLAAQVGSRYSVVNPDSYLRNNLTGFLNIIETCRHYGVRHLIYASSSSVYGNAGTQEDKANTDPKNRIERPVSLHASIKKSNELMAYSYCNLYGISMTGLRYFTVYGPWGRPDMSPMIFAKAINDGEPIKIFNNGDMKRNFTYIDDAIDITVKALDKEPTPNEEGLKYRIYDVASPAQIAIPDFISEMEKAFGKTTEKTLLPMQPGDFSQVAPFLDNLESELGHCSSSILSDGIRRFVQWYKSENNPVNSL